MKYLFFLLILMLTGCKYSFMQNRNETLIYDSTRTCRDYLLELSTTWYKDTSGTYGLMTKSPSDYVHFYANTNKCFQGYTVRKVKRILGEPNKETPNTLLYYMGPQCLDRNSHICNYQYFKVKDGFFEESLLIIPRPKPPLGKR